MLLMVWQLGLQVEPFLQFLAHVRALAAPIRTLHFI
jgi:hypothetical protein